MLDSIFGGKPWYKSVTGWGALIFAAGFAVIDGACGSSGLLAPETCEQITPWTTRVGELLMFLGIRKASA